MTQSPIDVDTESQIDAEPTEQDTAEELVSKLASRSGLIRLHARKALVAMGRDAVEPLMEALADRRGQVRWEAAKALAEIGDPTAAGSLIRALEDNRPGVRWLAGRGLVAMRKPGLIAVLHALMLHPQSPWLRQGAHHVLRQLAHQGFQEQLSPVLAALDDMEPTLVVPPAALEALDRLEKVA